jgi:hypothetical protein
MCSEQKHLFTIEEVTNSQSPYLSGMNRWLEQIFPEYCPLGLTSFSQNIDIQMANTKSKFSSVSTMAWL